jgi:hypothetical protein
MQNLEECLHISGKVPGFIRGEEALGLAMMSFSLQAHPIIVQIGTFMGSAAILIAGARKLSGTGKVHCVDPFDCSGDDFSIPFYTRLLIEAGGGPLRGHFERNIRDAGLEDWIEVHQGRAGEVARGWTAPIDMLVLGGDQSPAGARVAYESWHPFSNRTASSPFITPPLVSTPQLTTAIGASLLRKSFLRLIRIFAWSLTPLSRVAQVSLRREPERRTRPRRRYQHDASLFKVG